MSRDTMSPAEAAPLVLVHGFLSGSSYWAPVRDALESGRQIIAVDLPGFGKRCHEPAVDSIPGFASFVLAEMDRLGVDRFALLGHSMGGMIAQEIAHKAPQRVEVLILFGTGPEGELPGRFEPIAESRRKVIEQGTGPTVSYIVSNWYVKGTQDPWFAPSLGLAELACEAAVLGGLTAMESWRGVDFLSRHTMPTLVIWGDQDRAYPISQELALWQGISSARLAVIPDAGHNAHHEKPELFCALLDDFLAHHHIS